ncbi:hypothetical protein F3X87_19200 [Aeromonas caviae]|uniref:hypothetical protein n=2 Tax=Aeromonas caviae TaxID=648 RepID=UPI0012468ED4|nr:hypothetical protein [Aeromonas caviae]KAB0675087.1 hypothetical protein F3X87_19200 [Aeromonas caviae]
MNCYFQGCTETGITREHIPPRSFFPDGEKDQLLTVKSCEKHNNAKSKDDLYVLAQICMNASPSNRAREVFMNKVAPQLEFNNGALRKKLAEGAVPLDNGAVKYKVDVERLDDFFTALSCGIIYKSCGSSLPANYKISHIYHNFRSEADSETREIENAINTYYSGKPMDIMEFGDPDTKNERIYTVTIFGIPKFQSSITIVHRFFGVFKVTSMLTRVVAAGLANPAE